MTGFEPRISGFRSDGSTNCAQLLLNIGVLVYASEQIDYDYSLELIRHLATRQETEVYHNRN